MDSETRPSYTYVDTPAALERLIPRLEQAPRVALDIEANSLYRYFLRVCLIQITFHGENWIVDPLAHLDLSRFLSVLSEKPLLLHGGDYDLRMLRTSLDFQPHGEVFDTMLAAQVLGCDQVGLAALADRYLGVTLSKHSQKSNWAQRPLQPKQLAYAVDDTRHLEALADRLTAEMEALGRVHWHRSMCRRMVHSASYEELPEPDPNDAWRIKGSALLEPRQLAVVRQVWHWREEEARKIDRPAFKILGNPEILALAEWAVEHRDRSVLEWPQLPRNLTGRRLEGLKRAVRHAQRLPGNEWPEKYRPRHSGPPEPDCRIEIETLAAECARVAQDLNVPPSLLAPRTALVGIARRRPKTVEEVAEAGSLLDWQAELLGQRFLDALETCRARRKGRGNGRARRRQQAAKE